MPRLRLRSEARCFLPGRWLVIAWERTTGTAGGSFPMLTGIASTIGACWRVRYRFVRDYGDLATQSGRLEREDPGLWGRGLSSRGQSTPQSRILSKFCGEIAVDLQPDADFDECWCSPCHGTWPPVKKNPSRLSVRLGRGKGPNSCVLL
jgi:hypothetical protein